MPFTKQEGLEWTDAILDFEAKLARELASAQDPREFLDGLVECIERDAEAGGWHTELEAMLDSRNSWHRLTAAERMHALASPHSYKTIEESMPDYLGKIESMARSGETRTRFERWLLENGSGVETFSRLSKVACSELAERLRAEGFDASSSGCPVGGLVFWHVDVAW